MPIKITMPALSPTMTEGTLAKWLKAEGDAIESGDVIAEIETDKATMEVEAVDDGVIGKIIVSEGSIVPVNEMIAVLLEDGENAADVDAFVAGGGASAVPVATDKKDPAQATKNPSPNLPTGEGNGASSEALASGVSKVGEGTSAGARVFASPLAKRIAAEKGLDLSTLKGSGPHGRIVKADVENAKAGGAVAPAAGASVARSAPASSGPDAKALSDMLGMEYEEIPNNNIKKITAQRLLESKQSVPHFYLTVECNLDNLLAARKELNDKANGAYKISVNDFIIKANAMALKAHPAANVAWAGDVTLQYKQSDISVAVATPNGLITPIIKAAEEKGLQEISVEMKDLAGRAREGKLKPEEFQGGTFTISNLGMFGVSEFAAILNPPQSCIMAVGAGVQKPVVVGGEVKVATVMKVTLSTDHRTVDGVVGAEFLQYFKQFIENPVAMLL